MIGILGGTFDPIHNGHLFVANSLAALESFSEIKLIPCKAPVHKNITMASTEQRIEMIRLAIRDFPKLSLDLREINRDTPSFMIETLINLRQEFPNQSLVLIIGMDNFMNLPTWKNWELFLDYAHILVVSRPKAKLNWSHELEKVFKDKCVANIEKLTKHLFGNVIFYTMDSLNISATEIREQFKKGVIPEKALPDAVVKYILAERVYSKN